MSQETSLKLKSFRLLSVSLVPEKGAKKEECFQEALELVVKLWCDVHFCFNDKGYRILINDLSAQISVDKDSSGPPPGIDLVGEDGNG